MAFRETYGIIMENLFRMLFIELIYYHFRSSSGWFFFLGNFLRLRWFHNSGNDGTLITLSVTTDCSSCELTVLLSLLSLFFFAWLSRRECEYSHLTWRMILDRFKLNNSLFSKKLFQNAFTEPSTQFQCFETFWPEVKRKSIQI